MITRTLPVVVLALLLGTCAEPRQARMLDMPAYQLDTAFNACMDKARSLGQGMATIHKETIFHACMSADYGYTPGDYKARWLVF